jgi:hypothetical protein
MGAIVPLDPEEEKEEEEDLFEGAADALKDEVFLPLTGPFFTFSYWLRRSEVVGLFLVLLSSS